LLDKYGCADATPSIRACDHAAACLAGLAGGILDLRPRLSAAMTNDSLHHQLDAAYKKRLSEVAGKGVAAIDNVIGGPTHRLVGPTHDVLRFLKAIQCIRQGKFESAVAGYPKLAQSYRTGAESYLKVEDPLDAAVLLLIHWSADFFSKASLPL